jgi:hypothetical protein
MSAAPLGIALIVALACPAWPQPSPPAASDSAGNDDASTVRALSRVVARDYNARMDIGARLVLFVQGKDGQERRYLAPDLQKDGDGVRLVAEAAKAWPEKNKDDAGKVAALFFAIGPGGDLADLQNALAREHWTDTKQIPLKGASDATAAFLEEAAAQAQKILAGGQDGLEQAPRTDSTAANRKALQAANAAAGGFDGASHPPPAPPPPADKPSLSETYQADAGVRTLNGPRGAGKQSFIGGNATVNYANGPWNGSAYVNDYTTLRGAQLGVDVAASVNRDLNSTNSLGFQFNRNSDDGDGTPRGVSGRLGDTITLLDSIDSAPPSPEQTGPKQELTVTPSIGPNIGGNSDGSKPKPTMSPDVIAAYTAAWKAWKGSETVEVETNGNGRLNAPKMTGDVAFYSTTGLIYAISAKASVALTYALTRRAESPGLDYSKTSRGITAGYTLSF